MFVKITAKRQVTFQQRLLEVLGVGPGDRLELQDSPEGFILRPQRIEPTRLAPLRTKLRRGQGDFDLESFRDQPYDTALRD